MVVKNFLNEEVLAENVDADQHVECLHNFITHFLIAFLGYYLEQTQEGEIP